MPWKYVRVRYCGGEQAEEMLRAGEASECEVTLRYRYHDTGAGNSHSNIESESPEKRDGRKTSWRTTENEKRKMTLITGEIPLLN